MLTFRVYYERPFWWFEVVDVDPQNNTVIVNRLFRRRCTSKKQAERRGLQAKEHVKNQRRERWASLHGAEGAHDAQA